MSDTPEILHVDLVAQPHLPLILADTAFLTTLRKVEEQITTFKITDTTTAQAAADLQARLTTAGSKLEKARVDLVAPFLAQQRKINEAARAPAERIDAAKKALSRLQTQYAMDQAAIVRKAEADRQAELAALEKKRQEELAAEQKRVAELEWQAAEIAKQAQASGREMLDEEEEPQAPPPTATEEKIAAIMAAPAVVAPRPSGVRMVVSLKAIVVDVNALPDVFVAKTAKQAAINAAFCTGWREEQDMPVCPGVRFEVERKVESTGRAAF